MKHFLPPLFSVPLTMAINNDTVQIIVNGLVSIAIAEIYNRYKLQKSKRNGKKE